ncbi:hypothetical protein G5714_020976 [Onychostoma macrolepis]|uniref:Uncharacterized protein n=1 Tax=Onychostoma macrolepis TaxID=369639 RepID=A0A7J6BVC9_9TELE|nr:hypothetical protein G5714_020976 [Onychostoma macrolepis]
MKREISAVIDFLQDFREHGFNAAKIDAREIAEKIEVKMIWPDVRQKKTKRQFDYEGTEETTSNAEEHFRREFFLHLVDTALVKTRERFSYMENFFKLYGFLYSTDIMKSTVQAGSLDECCNRFEKAVEDVDAGDLKMEITDKKRHEEDDREEESKGQRQKQTEHSALKHSHKEEQERKRKKDKGEKERKKPITNFWIAKVQLLHLCIMLV